MNLREHAESVEVVRLRLRGEYGHAFKVGRTEPIHGVLCAIASRVRYCLVIAPP